MRKTMTLLAAGLILAVAGCNTIGGAGQDLQQGGKAVTKQANETKQEM